VRAQVIQITPRVSGPLVKLPVADNQFVKAGDLLFEIDQRTFEAALEQARAEFDDTRDEIQALEKQVAAAQAKLEAAEATTKIRLLTGHLTSIPNLQMANAEIENNGRRPHIRRVFNVTITYDTQPEKINRAIEILWEILAVPEGPDEKSTDATAKPADATAAEKQAGTSAITQAPPALAAMVEDIEGDYHPNWAINRPDFEPQVSFNEFNADSLIIVVFYWYNPPDYWKYLNHATWINTQIVERFNAEGIDFAFPTQTLHLAGDDKRPLDAGQ